MPRRLGFVAVAALTGVAGLVACGDDNDSAGDEAVTTSTAEATTITTTAPTTTTSTGSSPPSEPECSASGHAREPKSQDLPGPVAEMRKKIVAAAVACDYEALAALGRPGTFSWTFGASDDPAAFWRQGETSGEPLRMLVELLDRPVATRSPDGAAQQYVWPRAYAYEKWSDVPAEARQELEPLYGPDDFERFSRFGSYSGARVGITGDGDWQFYVAGD